MRVIFSRPSLLNIILFFIVLTEVFLLWPQNSFSESEHTVVAKLSPTPTLTPTPTPIPFFPPQRLRIPKINIDTNVEKVGVGDDGKLLVSSIPENVGWYRMGRMPGEKGTAVIVGHLDRVTGAPAVFYNLRQLEIGDEVYVTDQMGKQMKFLIHKKESYPVNDMPLQDVFHGESTSSILNLITCDGFFTPGYGYSHRIVISAQRVE